MRVISAMRCVTISTQEPALAQLADFCEQSLGRIEIERRGGFVEDEDLRLGQQRPTDGDPRLQIERQHAGGHVEIEVEAGQLRHQRLGAPDLGRPRVERPRPQPVGARDRDCRGSSFRRRPAPPETPWRRRSRARHAANLECDRECSPARHLSAARPEITLASVLLPLPLPPNIAWISPSDALNEAPSSALVTSNDFRTPTTRHRLRSERRAVPRRGPQPKIALTSAPSDH